jgi:hypothetical protein
MVITTAAAAVATVSSPSSTSAATHGIFCVSRSNTVSFLKY